MILGTGDKVESSPVLSNFLKAVDYVVPAK
jgi:hypothetical protein